MALHEYECSECEHITVKLFFGSEKVPSLICCENCESMANKIISASIAIVKGFSSDNSYGDARNVKPLDQKRAKERAVSQANRLNKGKNAQ